MEILIIFLLIALNGFFALSEIAFVSSRREIIESERDRGARNAVAVLRMMDEPDRFLSSIQVGITLIGVVTGAYGGITLADDLSAFITRTGLSLKIAHDIALVFVVGSITCFSIVLGELVPKIIGLRNPEKIVMSVIPVVKAFSVLMYPVIIFLSWSTKIILRIIGIKPAGIDISDDPLREILGIAKAAAIKNKISPEQEGIIANTARLKSTKLYQIMIKRADMKFLTTALTMSDALVASHIHHHTRFPLTDEKTGEIIGYINFKDIVNSLRLNPSNPSLSGISRPIISFGENDTINVVLRRLISTHQHIALVRSAESKVVGLVTLEDILETIVGNIQDEYDSIPDYFYEISPGRFVSGGGITLKKLRLLLGNSIPDDEHTVDLWLREHLGSNIKAEMTMAHDPFLFIIRKVSRSHVTEVIIENKQANPT